MVLLTDTKLRAKLADGSLTGAWTLDPSRSVVELRTKSMWGMAPVKGRFTALAGEGRVSADGTVTGTIRVDASSLDTKNKKRDTHLRSRDFFDSENHPQFVFTAERVTTADSGLTVHGTLVVRGRSLPLTFPATVSTSGEELVQVDAEVLVDRSELGMSWNQLGMASMKNTLTIRAVFTRG